MIPVKLNPIGKRGLPSGYTRVGWLESTRTQYIDTGYYPCWDSAISVDACLTRVGANTVYYASVEKKTEGGGQRWDGAYFICSYGGRSDGWVSHGMQSGVTQLSGVYAHNQQQHIEASSNGIFIDGWKVDETFEPSIYRNSCSLYLFARNYQNSLELLGDARIWRFSVKEKGVAKCDFIPCLDSTGTPCMYDLVRREAFYNAGAGDFLYPAPAAAARTYRMTRPYKPEYAQLTPHGVRRLYKVPDGCELSIEEYAARNAFKRLFEPEKSEEGYWTPQWTETEEEIVLEWVETESPIDMDGLQMSIENC